MSQEKRISRRRALRAAAVGAGGLAALLGVAVTAEAAPSHPRLRRAIDSMKDARSLLKDAPDIFGHHKERAIKALTVGIEELNAALDFARDHGH